MPGQRTQKALWATIAAIVCLIATACSSSGGGSNASTTPSNTAPATTSTSSANGGIDTAALDKILEPVSTEPTALQVTTPLSKKPPTGIKVVGLSDGLVDENLYFKGMSQAAKVLGWDFSVQSIDDSNVQTVISGATSAINAGAKVVVMVTQLQTTIDKFLPLAVSHHAIILDTISSNAAHTGQVLADTESHEYNTQGQYAAAAILKSAAATGATAHIGETFIPQFATGIVPEENGFKKTMSEQCPACTLDRINISLQDVQSGSYIKDITSYIQTHPNMNYLFATNAFFVNGLIPALKQAGIKVPKIVGTEPTAANFSDIKAGADQEWFYVPQQVLGWVWTDELARYFVGDDYNIWNTTAYAPQWLLNAQNISQVADVKNFDFPAGYQQTFTTMWNAGS